MKTPQHNWCGAARQKNFIVRGRNTGFTCANCQQQVKPHPTSTRNHCPFCLTSKHVDNRLPGDRLSDCGGLMPTVAVEKHAKAGYRLIQNCKKCKFSRANITAPDDNFDKIILIAGKYRQSESYRQGS